ncbi:acetyltransferase (GNAT) family protein [Hoeflea halophila]|uniref:Acetyltransferase (GNAT) family protein n=1 Tax=Hoeflea halophila TaxID=714899 RepID=A0A286HQK3_9HYPH|nr:GNAT family N-acetyltransferase [Hoeflea halophila]SOE09414.1 acetyltransferase (GNAT) family protein [Hoeflea halophila]
MTLEITVDETGDPEFAAMIEAIVDEPAARRGHPFDPVPLHLKAVDTEGRLAGGLTAHSVQRWLFVKLLGVPEEQRGSGIGRKLLAKAEEIARQRGHVGVYLDTFEFQAPRFYESLGYEECGRLPAHGGAPQRIWFAKTFDLAGGVQAQCD